LRFYEITEVPLLPNYLGIGFWLDAFQEQSKGLNSNQKIYKLTGIISCNIF